MRDVALANIEVLATGEDDDDCAVYSAEEWEHYYREDGTGYNCFKTGDECC